MECNELNNKNVSKAKFYFEEKIKAHVLTIPKGTFKNGLFVSELQQDQFFWFIEDTGIPFRLFLNEIYDIMDYKSEVKE